MTFINVVASHYIASIWKDENMGNIFEDPKNLMLLKIKIRLSAIFFLQNVSLYVLRIFQKQDNDLVIVIYMHTIKSLKSAIWIDFSFMGEGGMVTRYIRIGAIMTSYCTFQAALLRTAFVLEYTTVNFSIPNIAHFIVLKIFSI